MRKSYIISRIIAYIFSGGGLILLLAARRYEALGERTRLVAAVLIITGFAAFFISYGIYIMSQLKRSRPDE